MTQSGWALRGAMLAVGLLPLAAWAQLRVQALSDSGGELRIPQVAGGDAAAVQRINTWLQVSELQKLPGHYRKSPFEDMELKPGDTTGVSSLDYTVQSNTPGYLSLQVQGEYDAATVNTYSFTYNFDARTGRSIMLSDLFTPAGLEKLRAELRASRRQQIDAYLAQLPQPGDTQDDPAETEAERQMYSACRDTVAHDDLASDELTLGKDKLQLSMDCATTHYEQAVEDGLGPLQDSYAFAALREQLSDYGRCLLLERREHCPQPPRTLAAGLWHGSLGGRYPITLAYGLPGADGYFYDKFGQFIPLEGGLQADGSLRLDENPDSGPKAEFRLRLQPDGSLKGDWLQQGTGKTLAVELHD